MKVKELLGDNGTIITVIVAVLFVFGTLYGVWCWQNDKTDRGSFGDLFGSVNALYSGLAFIGVVYAMLLQREELQLQREELKSTRDELKRTADAQEKSEQQMVRQNKFNQITARLNASNTLVRLYMMFYKKLSKNRLILFLPIIINLKLKTIKIRL